MTLPRTNCVSPRVLSQGPELPQDLDLTIATWPRVWLLRSSGSLELESHLLRAEVQHARFSL